MPKYVISRLTYVYNSDSESFGDTTGYDMNSVVSTFESKLHKWLRLRFPLAVIKIEGEQTKRPGMADFEYREVVGKRAVKHGFECREPWQLGDQVKQAADAAADKAWDDWCRNAKVKRIEPAE